MKKATFLILAAAAILGLVWVVFGNKSDSDPGHFAVNTPELPRPVGPYSPAVRYGNLVFISGQIGLKKDGTLDSSSFANEAKLVFENTGELLKASGSSWNHVLKTTVYLTDLAKFKEFNDLYSLNFPKGKFPARETIQVDALPKQAHLEISVIASVP